MNSATVTNSDDTLEHLMAQRGLDRAKRKNEREAGRGLWSQTGGGAGLVKQCLLPLSQAISEFLVAAEARKGQKPTLLLRAGHMHPDQLAFLALKVALDCAAIHAPLTRTARAIGRAVEDEERLRVFAGKDPMLYSGIIKTLRRRGSSPTHARNAWSVQARNAEIEIPRWAGNDTLHVGVALLDMVISSTGLVENRLKIVKRNKGQWFIELTAHAIEWAQKRDEALAIARPVYLPTDQQPVQWASQRGGGYSEGVLPLPLVKQTRPEHRELLNQVDLSKTYEALNHVQGTPWCINKRILEVMKAATETGSSLPAIPSLTEQALPPKPLDFETNEDARREWKFQAKHVYEARVKDRSATFDFHRLLETATELKDKPSLFFPHNIDFRGRLYSVPSLLSPQGRDEARALLQFRDGDSVRDRASVRWAKINGANLFGYDKASFDDRCQWVDDHWLYIAHCVIDPMQHQWWTEADKPWSFLAWCFDYHGIKLGDGLTFLPVALDGSCNGIQHFSAMLRDPIGAAAVNLLPSETPQDIYAAVASEVMARLKAKAIADKDWIAEGWVSFGIDRKITKRPVMVLPYGGTINSCRDYVIAAVHEAIKGGKPNPFGTELKQALSLLVSTVWASIGAVVVGARQVMGWLQSVARIAAAHQLPLMWETPSGFLAYQWYPELKLRRVKTRMRGMLIKPSTYEETDKIDRHRQAQAIAPNFVHSMDAAALVATTCMAYEHGVKSFAMIHDSYGTTAAHTQTLAEVLRQSFVDMYVNHDVLQEFADSVQRSLPEGVVLPPVPSKGSLDITKVLDSPYFFA